MSSRLLKKISDKYSNPNCESPIEDDLSPDNNDESFSVSNKFSLLLSDSTDTDKEEETKEEESEKYEKIDKTKINKKVKNNKLKEKSTKNCDKYKNMTEDEIMEMFINSFDANDEDKNPKSEAKRKNSKQSIDILSLKIRNLNENIELQQLFGRTSIEEPNNAHNNRLRQRNANPITKFTFGKRGVNWPNVSVNKLGLRMEPVGDNRDSNGLKWCTVSCSNEYLQAERSLKAAMRTGAYPDHLRDHPYHLNTLLQMAALLEHQEDLATAADLYRRVFYVYETIAPLGLSLLGADQSGGAAHDSLTKTRFGLDYRYRLNRPIFIALFQWVRYLCQKSCFNTALEYCKLLLSLNVAGDPLAIILLIDDIALRCDQFDYFIDFYRHFSDKKALKYLPNFSFSISLCYFFKSYSSKKSNGVDSDLIESNELLQRALTYFPSFLKKFINLCSVQIDDVVRKSQFFFPSISGENNDPSSLECLIELYLKRSVNFWKSPSVLGWLESNTILLLEKLSCPDIASALLSERKFVINMYNRETPLSIRRHFFLSGYRDLAPQSGTDHFLLAFDPFPPINGDGGFDHYVENESQVPLNESWLINFLRSFSPSFDL